MTINHIRFAVVDSQGGLVECKEWAFYKTKEEAETAIKNIINVWIKQKKMLGIEEDNEDDLIFVKEFEFDENFYCAQINVELYEELYDDNPLEI